MLDRSRSRDRSKTGGAFSPAGLFVTGAQGAWYDPSDYSTLFQNASGTTPVTAVEQPVRLMLDRSRGLVLGANIAPAVSALTASSIDNSGGASSTFSAGVFSITVGSSNSSYPRARISVPGLTVGKTYRVRGTSAITGTIVAFLVRLATGGTANTVASAATTSFDGIAVCGEAGIIEISLSSSPTGATGTITISSLTVEELPGNHATAPNDASRPVLRARYNLLTFSEQFDNAAWTKTNATVTANAAVAPDGTTTADKMVPSTSNVVQQVNQSATIVAGIHTQSVYAKADGYSFLQFNNSQSGSDFANFDLSNGTVGTTGGTVTATITALANGWYRCIVTYSAFTAGSVNFRNQIVGSSTASRAAAFQGDGTSGILIWGAQLLTAADATATGNAYQRVAAATDYDTSNPVWRPYLAFDGSDDSFSTSAIDFSGTDEMTVFAGVTKLSDAAFAIMAELSATSASNNGTFAFFAPFDAAQQNYGARSRGTSSAQASGPASGAGALPAPNTSVLTMLADISAPSLSLAINGAAYASSTSTQGTGNFGNYPLFIGRRNNTSNPFNGRLYGLTVLGRTATAAELSAMETWINGKTGVAI